MLGAATRGWFLIVLVCAMLSGCCKKKIDDDGALDLGDEDSDVVERGDSHRDSKIDRTIKCFNAAMRINKSANYYFERLRGGEPRPGRIPSIVFKPPQNTEQLCEEAKGDLTPPMPEVDKIMPRYVELVTILSKQLDEMDEYYKSKGYLADKYKRGKAMHEGFKKDHEEFLKLHEDLSIAIDAVADKRDDESIEKESKTKGLRYFSLLFLRDAKQLSREIAKDKPNKEAFIDFRARIESSHKALVEHADNNPEQVAKAFMFSMYKGRADTFLESVRNTDPNKMREQDLDDMLSKYNSMIDASNLVRWRQ